MPDRNDSSASEFKETSRLEAFSDGVFSIAVTLLVLDLIEILHTKNNNGLVQLCIENWQSFLAFSIGFITILVCWINHHTALECIKKTDINFFWINGFLLFIVTLTPFSTAILAEYLEKESRTALAVFGFNYILISIAADCICTYAYNHHLVVEIHRKYYHTYKKIYRYAIFYNVIAFLLCFISVIVPIILYILLFAAFAAPKKFAAAIKRARSTRRTILKNNQPSGSNT